MRVLVLREPRAQLARPLHQRPGNAVALCFRRIGLLDGADDQRPDRSPGLLSSIPQPVVERLRDVHRCSYCHDIIMSQVTRSLSAREQALSQPWGGLHFSANGLLIRTPRISCPSFKSSVYSTAAPVRAAATTTSASQKESLASAANSTAARIAA